MRYEYVDTIPYKRSYTRWQTLLEEFFASDQKIVKITLDKDDSAPKTAQSAVVYAAKRMGMRVKSHLVDDVLYLEKI